MGRGKEILERVIDDFRDKFPRGAEAVLLLEDAPSPGLERWPVVIDSDIMRTPDNVWVDVVFNRLPLLGKVARVPITKIRSTT